MTNQPLFDPTLEEIHVQIAKFSFDRKKTYYKIILLILLEFLSIMFLYYVLKSPMRYPVDQSNSSFLIFIISFFSPIIIPFAIHYMWEKIQALDIDILGLTEKEMKLAADPTAAAMTKGLFKELVGFNIQYLHAYNDLIKDHTQKSFLVSIVSGIFGFGLIVWGIWLGFQDKNNLAYLSTASGIIIEFIAVAFFYLYNKTVRELKEYHNSLLDVQNILLSFNIVQDLEGDTKAEMLSQIIASILGRRESLTSERTATVSDVSNNPAKQK
jgi:hypothetical protein